MGSPPNCLASFDHDLPTWLQKNCCSTATHASTINWNTLFPLVCWNIWKTRNSLCFAPNNPIPFKSDLVFATAIEWKHLNDQKQFPKRRNTIQIGWQDPSTGFIELNTNGATQGFNGKASGWGVFRDATGNWILGYCRFIRFTSTIGAELWTLRDGLKLAWEKNFTNLEIETDSKLMQTLLQSTPNMQHHLNNLIFYCRFLMELLGIQAIKHIYREANECADIIAKLGFDPMLGLQCFHFAPSIIVNQLYDDANGVLYLRLVHS
ncbi:hypothetical protein ACSBR1_020212 [Camellia fascicularis]